MRCELTRDFTATSASLCVQLNPPFVPNGTSMKTCVNCSCVPCACQQLTELTEYAKKAAKFAGFVRIDVAFFEQFGPGGLEVSAFIGLREGDSPVWLKLLSV